MQTVMKSGHSFSQVPKADIQRSSFDRSHGHKTTFDSGYLVPIWWDEALPGDTYNVRMSAFVRMSTLLKPIMDNLYLETFFFSVPNRLLWSHWEQFNGSQTNPGDATDYTVPQIQSPGGAGILVGSLSDYLGLPTGIATQFYFNSLWHRAYAAVYNSWFRDENLQNSVVQDTGDGPDTYSNYVLKRRGKRFDYFTSALPWPQKNANPVSIPLGTRANVLGIGEVAGATPSSVTFNQSDGTTLTGTSGFTTSGGANAIIWKKAATDKPDIYADLTNATAATINSLRQAFQLQKFYERDARGGTRYIEIVKAHFNVDSPDLRATRPEYLGGGSSPINVHPVPQTSVAGATPQANLAAFGTGSVQGHGFTKSFTEHCTLIGLVNVRADLTYQQGLNRAFTRRTRADYYWPSFAHLGEQAILNREIYCDGSGNDVLTFGYGERYAEYRYKPSLITGKFRSTYATPLDVYHLSQKFTSLPTLGDTFISDTPPIDRVVAVNTEPQFLIDTFFKQICARPMPVYGVPGLIDHF